jgi:hypothetical protein
MRDRARGGALFALIACSVLLVSSLVSSEASAVSSTTATTAAAASPPAQGATPASLFLSVVPPKLPADSGSYPSIVVSLQSSGGKASLALADTVVFLTSSQESVGGVSQQVTIPKGAGFAVANFTTSTTPGTTSISASSAGLSAVSTQVITVTPSGFATRLRVIPVPGSQIVNPTGKGTIMVETLDSAGFPAKATAAIAVTLSSSNNNLSVASGSVLSYATYDVGFFPGVATITGSASGFNSGSGTVTVQGPSPFAIKILAQPNPLATSSSGRLVVTLTDPQGNPARAPSPVSVAISSSNTTEVS